MSTVLIVNGTSYNQSSRKANSLLIDGWGWDLDGDFWAELSEYCAGPQPKFTGPVPVSLTISGTTVFSGSIISVEPSFGSFGRTWGYRCLGLKYAANWIPVTAADGSGLILFNVSPVDVDNYVASFAGQSVGQIISYCLTQHSTALTAAGITTDGTTASQLAALTLVPNEQVEVAGERLWSAMESVLQRWARNIRLVILPSGLVRAIDITTGSAHTLTVGTDPIDPPLFSRNWTHSATAVSVRGKGIIEPAYVSQVKTTVQPAWNGTAQTNWKWSEFTNPTGADDKGTVTTVNSPTQVTVRSSNASLTWATNYWSGLQAWIYLTKTAGSGLTYTEARPITANAALTAGGTATVNLAYDLQNSGASAYDSYEIIGVNVPLASGGLADVWRLYNIVDEGTSTPSYISQHLVAAFPVDVPFKDYFGTVAVLTTTPCGQIVKNGSAGPAFFRVDPMHGQILMNRPVVEQFNTYANLQLGGSHVSAPDDVFLLLAYSRGALSTRYPTSSYSGTAFSVAGLSRVQTVDVETWRYGGNASQLNNLAQMLQASVCNTLMEGMVNYKGFYATVQSPSGGHLLSFAGNGYTTGDESLNIPVRAVSYRYFNNSGTGLNYATSMKCSTRQDPRTGEGYYTHLSVLGSGSQFGSGFMSFGGLANATFAGSILPEATPDDLSGLGPTFNPEELAAGNRMQRDESNAAGSMGAAENAAGPGQGGGKYEDVTYRRRRKLRERDASRQQNDLSDFAMPGQAAAPIPGLGPNANLIGDDGTPVASAKPPPAPAPGPAAVPSPPSKPAQDDMSDLAMPGSAAASSPSLGPNANLNLGGDLGPGSIASGS
jgi:hypothetical protein